MLPQSICQVIIPVKKEKNKPEPLAPTQAFQNFALIEERRSSEFYLIIRT
jgi:hypothetical protein